MNVIKFVILIHDIKEKIILHKADTVGKDKNE